MPDVARENMAAVDENAAAAKNTVTAHKVATSAAQLAEGFVLIDSTVKALHEQAKGLRRLADLFSVESHGEQVALLAERKRTPPETLESTCFDAGMIRR